MVNEVLAQAVTGTQSDGPAASVPDRNKLVQYWRMCNIEGCQRHSRSEGWISTGPVLSSFTAQEYAEFQTKKHAEPLDEYGKHNPDLFRDAGQRFAKLIEGGGLKEMPTSQLTTYGWHHIPEMVVARPELENVVEFYCEHGCPTKGSGARWFLTQEDYKQHTTAIHSDVAPSQAIGVQLKEAIEGIAAAQKLDMGQLAAGIVKAVKELEIPEVNEEVDNG